MNYKHTPGPWEWWTSNSLMRLTGADGKDGGVLYAAMHSGVPDVSVSEANARLIAAAPDLLRVLEDAESMLQELKLTCASADEEGAVTHQINEINEVIAKATGAA